MCDSNLSLPKKIRFRDEPRFIITHIPHRFGHNMLLKSIIGIRPEEFLKILRIVLLRVQPLTELRRMQDDGHTVVDLFHHLIG